MRRHGVEVAIVVQKEMASLETKRRDHEVDRFADGDAALAQQSIVRGRARRERLVQHAFDCELAQRSFDARRMRLVSRSLQNFKQNNVADEDRARVFDRVQLSDSATSFAA